MCSRECRDWHEGRLNRLCVVSSFQPLIAIFILARDACNAAGEVPYMDYWHAGTQALTVKTTVPNTCTPPFPKNLSTPSTLHAPDPAAS
jgi:hypothetical protein